MTKDAMYSNSERNFRDVSIEQVKDIVAMLDPSAANSIIIDEAVGVRRANYCYVDVASKRVRYDVERRHFHPREELVGMMEEVLSDTGDSPYIRLKDREIMELIGGSPKVSLSRSIKNAFSNMTMRNDVDATQIVLDAEGSLLSDKQPLYLVKSLCSMEPCARCHGTKVVERVDKKTGVVETEACSECQGTGRIASVGVVNIEVKSHSDKYVLTNEDPIENLKDSMIVDHVLDHSKIRYRSLTRFNELDEKNYDPTLGQYIEEIHELMGGEPATEDIYYQIIPCVEFTYRDVMSGNICKGAVIDAIDNPELVMNLTSDLSKVGSAMKNASKSVGGFLNKIGRTEKGKAKEDLKRMTRLLIAVTISDGKVDTKEKEQLLNQLRDMEDFTTGEKDDFAELLGSEDVSFLKDGDFKFHSPEKAQETLNRMRIIAEADGEMSDAERDLIERLEQSL